MHLPYLQLDDRFITHGAHALAMRLECSDEVAGWCVIRLWQWAVGRIAMRAPDMHAEVSRAALVMDGGNLSAARVLADAARYMGPDPEAFASMCADPDVGVLEAVPGGYRIRGLVHRYADAAQDGQEARARNSARKYLDRHGWKYDPVAKTWGQPSHRETFANATQAAAFVKANAAHSRASPATRAPPALVSATPAPAPVQAPLAMEPTPAAPPAHRPPRSRSRKAPPAADGPPAEPTAYAQANTAAHEAFEAVRGVPYTFDGGRDGRALKLILYGTAKPSDAEKASPRVTPEEVGRRFRVGLQWRGFPSCGSIHELQTHWNTYATEQTQAGRPVDPRRGMIRAEDQRSTGAIGEVVI